MSGFEIITPRGDDVRIWNHHNWSLPSSGGDDVRGLKSSQLKSSLLRRRRCQELISTQLKSSLLLEETISGFEIIPTEVLTHQEETMSSVEIISLHFNHHFISVITISPGEVDVTFWNHLNSTQFNSIQLNSTAFSGEHHSSEWDDIMF
jgi:hypothetical protein